MPRTAMLTLPRDGVSLAESVVFTRVAESGERSGFIFARGRRVADVSATVADED
jgi:hypothetical protein